jgi:DNA primase
MTNQVEQIKDRLDILDVIKGYVKLKKAGQSHKGLCPFHSEKTPSFNVSSERQMWYCFGCAEGGDVFTFLQRIEGIEFADALRMLADKAGVKLEKQDPQIQSKRKEIYDILNLSEKFFVKQMESKTGKAVVEYLKERGLKSATIKDWRLGYAPDEWRSLHSFLKQKGYSEESIENAGLLIKSNNQAHPHHDRFRHRVIFPILDVQGQVIGFAGRVFEKITGKTVGKEAGKYINTSNTAVYDKSRVLYGIDKAKLDIKAEDNCIVAEGNLDVILAHQAGTKNIIAVSGTALADQHLNIIKRYTNNLTLCFDSDDAGERATRRGAENTIGRGLNVSIIELPKGKDIADIIEKDEKDWIKIIKKPVPFLSFVLSKSLEKFSTKTLEGKKAIAQNVLTSIKKLPSPIEQEHWVGELALAIGLSEDVLREEMKTIKIDSTVQESAIESQETKTTSPDNNLEEYLLAMLIKYPEGRKYLGKKIDFIKSTEIKSAVEDMVKGKKAKEVIGRHKSFTRVVMRAEFLEEIIEDEDQEFLTTIGQLKRRKVKLELKLIEADLKKAERSNDLDNIQTLLGQFNSLSQELTTYEKESK